jgi:hypothetical protein
LADEGAEDIVEKEETSQDKTPVIPSAPAPNVPTNKKQTKKQRQANKKGAAAVPAATAKSEAPAPVLSTQKAQPVVGPSTQKAQQSKTTPIAVPAKAGKKGSLADGDDISSTPKLNVLKHLAQPANEDINEREDDSPTTPRPAPANKKGAVQSNNSWARGKGAGKAVVDSTFGQYLLVEGSDEEVDRCWYADDGIAESMEAMSSRPVPDRMNGKKNGDAASSPQVPGLWTWATPSSDKRKAGRSQWLLLGPARTRQRDNPRIQQPLTPRRQIRSRKRVKGPSSAL